MGPPTSIQTDLRAINESLVIAAVKAQALAEAAETSADKLAFNAEHDFLTGLPNRSLLTDRLTQAIELAKRQGRMVAFLYMDLDHFKNINDSLGHLVGDQLLQEVSRRLQACVRHSDTVSRHGGDEFVVLLPVVEALDDAALLARKLIEAMALPCVIQGHQLLVTLSIGISSFPNDGPDVDSVVRNADTAMYQAKKLGGNKYQVFTRNMDLPTGSPVPYEPAGRPALDPPEVHIAVSEVRPRPTARHDPGDRQGRALAGTLHSHDAQGPTSPATLILPEREAAALLNERTTDLREKAITEREKTLWPKEEAARVASEVSVSTQAQLQEANEHLVIATVEAQTMKEAAEQATVQLAKMSKLDAKLQEVQKLETLGILVRGVAHDFNNLLSTITDNAQMASLAVEEECDPSKNFKAIEQAVVRAADLTRQLMAYADKARIEMKKVDLGLVILEIIPLLQVSIPSHKTLQYDLADNLPLVQVDATQIFRVLMNLITNASEASPSHVPSTIAVRTREEAVDAAAINTGFWALPVVPGSYTTLEVKDAGSGMTPEVLARVFEPFYTTKFIGRGLGLAAVMGIIRSHGGGIKAESEPGHGTSFKIFLPAIKRAGG